MVLTDIFVGVVSGYDPANHAVYVITPGGQQIGFSVRVLIHGNADATRINQMPLPVMGTWGLVAIVGGDIRGAIWLGSFFQTYMDSITTSNPPTTDDTQIIYTSHNSGMYNLLKATGEYYQRFPDGTQFIVNIDNEIPKTYRHVVDSEGVKVLQEVTDKERVPNPPTPFYVAVKHKTGTSATITPLGIVSIKTGPGTSESPSEGPVIELNPLSSGLDAPQGTPAGGLQLIGQAGNSDIYMDKDGNIVVISNGVITSILLSATGDINIIASQNVNITATDNVNITATGSVGVTASGEIDITATGNVGVTADGDVDINSSSAVNVVAVGEVSVDAVGDVIINSSDEVQINAVNQIVLAGGGPGLARKGDTTVCPAGIGEITGGSSKAQSG